MLLFKLGFLKSTVSEEGYVVFFAEYHKKTGMCFLLAGKNYSIQTRIQIKIKQIKKFGFSLNDFVYLYKPSSSQTTC